MRGKFGWLLALAALAVALEARARALGLQEDLEAWVGIHAENEAKLRDRLEALEEPERALQVERELYDWIEDRK